MRTYCLVFHNFGNRPCSRLNNPLSWGSRTGATSSRARTQALPGMPSSPVVVLSAFSRCTASASSVQVTSNSDEKGAADSLNRIWLKTPGNGNHAVRAPPWITFQCLQQLAVGLALGPLYISLKGPLVHLQDGDASCETGSTGGALSRCLS